MSLLRLGFPKSGGGCIRLKGNSNSMFCMSTDESAYLIGRDRKVVDMPIDHPSCSKQPAALQYRLVQKKNEEGRDIKPYIMDLRSTNGTFVNNQKIDPQRYYELKERHSEVRLQHKRVCITN